LTDEDKYLSCLNKLAQEAFSDWQSAYRSQKRYMRALLVMDTNECPGKFMKNLAEMNRILKYFPFDDEQQEITEPLESLDEDELIEIADRAKDPQWEVTMAKQNKKPWDFKSLTEQATFFKGLYASKELQDRLDNAEVSPSQKYSKGRERKRPGKENNSDQRNKKAQKIVCQYKGCGKAHKTEECWNDPKNKDKRPKFWKEPGETPIIAAFGDSNNDVQGAIANDQKRLRLTKVVFANKNSHCPQENNSTKNESSGKRKAELLEEPIQVTEHDYQIGCPMIAYSTLDVTTHSDNSTSEDEFDGYSDIPEYLFPFFDRESLNKKTKVAQYTAETVVEILDRNGKLVPIRALLDTGTTSTLILRDFVKKGRANGYRGHETEWKTMGGIFKTKKKALIDFKFPELNTDKKVTWICHVDETTKHENALYDMIIGMDLMTAIGIYVDTEDKIIRWQGDTAPLGMKGALNELGTLEAIYNITQSKNTVLEQAEERQGRILDADYSAVDIDEHVDSIEDLTMDQKNLLKTILHKHKGLFQGGLGILNVKPIKLDLQRDAKPFHAKPFGIPQAFLATTRKEIDRLESIGVLKRNYESEWAAPTFIQPKKTGDVRILTDFRKLNEALHRKPFPLPKISDILQRLAGFTYATAIDLSMGYYHIPLDEESQKLCTTILPWGKYQYQRLPMGVKCGPDVFQAIVTDIFHDLEYVRSYIDDILITSSGSFEEHMHKLDIVLTRLEQAGFRANVRKCYFAQKELEYLGYWLSRQGVQPQPKKVEAIMRLQPPKNAKQLRHFLGMVNFYRDMWRRRSHLLAPLTQLVNKKKDYKWGPEQQKSFDEIKAVISKETLLAFPDFTKEFHIYTDVSDYQLGAVIMQDNRPLAFYSRKMTDTQQGYTTGEQELLSIVETLKEFKNILLGQKLIVHTDHKNILYDSDLSNDRIRRWKHLLEEYGPTYVHVAGKDNVVADALSRMDADFNMEAVENNSIQCMQTQPLDPRAYCCARSMSQLMRDESIEIPDGKKPSEVVEYLMAKNSNTVSENFPLSPPLIAQYQKKDRALLKETKDSPDKFGTTSLEGVDLIAYILPDHTKKIAVPHKLQNRIIAWYHEYLTHPGHKILEKAIAQTMFWNGMRKDVERYVRTCCKCQLCKKTNKKKHGLVPAKEAEPAVPWERVNVDMIGPYTVKQPNGKSLTLRAMTMIDPTTGWFEIKEVDNIDAAHAQAALDDTWLSRYPRPKYLGHDGGGEFKNVFEQMCENYGIQKFKGTAHNPQSNAIVERVHQVLGDMLRTFELEEQLLDEQNPWSRFLSAAAFSIRSTYHTTLEATPGQLVFGRDMVLPVKFQADWARIKMKRQNEIMRNNDRENQKRIPHHYQVGDQVLVQKPGILRKLSKPFDGPYTVERVYNNGTIRIRKGPLTTRINVRRCHPFHPSEV
jgi:RNase H-like domain found in reverse transcriptase/Reverse transcriptase (RNA-dependent DNA polymerase)/Integrase zinc binding domain